MPPLTTHHLALTEYLAFAHQLADCAGQIIRPYFQSELKIDLKDDASPVSAADREAEAMMREMIAMHYPGQAIYGEEYGLSSAITATHPFPESWSTITQIHSPEALQNSHNYTWVLDPIDGTRAFIAGRKEWGTLIALCENGVPILGILDQPVTGERWVGISGQPTTYYVIPAKAGISRAASASPYGHSRLRGNDVVIKTRPCASLADAELSTTSANYFTPMQAKQVAGLAQQCRATVKDGDCYAYGLLARGLRDVVVDAGLKPYDILALVPIIEGAGGRITTWDGGAVTLENYTDVVAVGDVELFDYTNKAL